MGKIIIEVNFSDMNGHEMEENLNKAIKSLSDALKIRGMSEMLLEGVDFDNIDKGNIYSVKIEK